MTTIKYGDKIKLVNQYTKETEVDAVPNAGYLDSYGNLGILGGVLLLLGAGAVDCRVRVRARAVVLLCGSVEGSSHGLGGKD